MKATEIYDLLSIINAFIPSFDPNDEQRVKAWKRVIGDKLSYAEAEKYLYEYFETNRFVPLPADLLKRKPCTVDPFKITEKEREYLGDVYRKQSERNASKRRAIRKFSERPDTVSSE